MARGKELEAAAVMVAARTERSSAARARVEEARATAVVGTARAATVEYPGEGQEEPLARVAVARAREGAARVVAARASVAEARVDNGV